MYLHGVIIAGLFLMSTATYWTERDEILKSEESKTIGASIRLTYAESVVNDFLMKIKLKELDEGFIDPSSFIPAYHLFDTLEKIENSEVFQFIKEFPKGSLLHGHDIALVSFDFLFNLTFSDNLHACIVDDIIDLKFIKEPVVENNCNWQPIQLLRESVTGFDKMLKSQLTLIREDYKSVYTDINIVWNHFSNLFRTVAPLVFYKPVLQDYFYQVLKELVEDNVLYIEFRTTLDPVYDLDGNIYGPLEVAAIFKEATEEFMLDYPDFLGVKLIYAPVRNVDNETMQFYIETLKGLKANFPDFVAGFDLVGQEDLGRPLIDFVDQLQEIKQLANLFFHAGETNWFGSTTDENLIDAVLLGTVRIGHGYAVLKHPKVLEIVKDNGIAIEICPISNQVLALNTDMRNHPGNYLIANDYPVIVSNDDPSFWGTKALSYDWYMAYMGMTSRHTDLRFLKQLAINSIEYSVYSNKTLAMNAWESKWNQFIEVYLSKIQET